MKHLKKIAGFLLALVMVFTMTANTFAAEKGSITINNAVEGQTYKVYQILSLESYDTTTDAYSYKPASDTWKTWLKTATTYVTVDENDYVTWVSGADAAAFAKLALEHAASTSISPAGTKTADGTTVTFSELDLGYYLLDSSLGSLCSLDTTNPDVTMEEKNAKPTINKTVEEDSTGVYGKLNDADLKQTVNFKSTITAQAGAQNYVFHDKMEDGLTFGRVTKITWKGSDVSEDQYTVKTESLSDDCTFEVVFKQEFCDGLAANDEVVIEYTASLNEDAKIGVPGNVNESYLTYGDNNKTEVSKTTTYTWDMSVLKYGNGDESNLLAGAQFKLLNKTKDKAAKFDENKKFVEWVDVENGTVLTTDEDGSIKVVGLDADTYYLDEIEPPKGYNRLSEPQKVEITRTEAENNTTYTYTPVAAKVNNNSGTELPSTGGIGTTIFYAAGSILVIAAAVLLITKKRMSTK